MPETYITPQMRDVVGLEVGRVTSFPITDSDIRRWAIATYFPERPPRLFWDAEYAARTSHGGIVAPEDFNPFAWLSRSAADADAVEGREDFPGPEVTLGIEPPATQAMVNGGIESEYGARMRPGDVITSVSTLAGYTEREGRLGLMLFTQTEAVWTNQDGVWIKTFRGTLIRY